MQIGSGVDLSYATIPVIPTLQNPLKDEVRRAFGESIAVVWEVMVGILGIGFLASLAMRDVPMHGQVDEKWGLEGETREGGNEGDIEGEKTPSELANLQSST